jgi:hypothetical protein
MPLTELDLKIIEKKIDGTLSAEQEDLFSSKLEDKEFASEWAFQKGTVESLRRIHLRNELKQHLLDNRIVTRQRFLYGIAAAVTAFIFLVSLYYLSQSSNSREEIFAAFYEPYPISATRGEAPLEQEIFALYQQGKYRLAVNNLLEIRKEPGVQNDPLIDLLIGNCFLNLSEPKRAAEFFNNLLKSEEVMLRDHGKWYLALTMLRTGDYPASNSLLQQLITSKSAYKIKAEKLSGELEKLD